MIDKTVCCLSRNKLDTNQMQMTDNKRLLRSNKQQNLPAHIVDYIFIASERVENSLV